MYSRTSIDFGNEVDGSCTVDGTLAYTLKDEVDELEKIHFCDDVFKLPLGGPDIDCNSLDKFPSTKMDTFSRVVLHETLHYSSVGPVSELGEHIIDHQNADGEVAYGPGRAHGLQDPEQDDEPGKSENNADNYAWMALSAWIGTNCQPDDKKDQYDTYFPEAPPRYS
jgi:hypothetical protein